MMGASAAELERDAHITAEAEDGEALRRKAGKHGKPANRFSTFVDNAFDDKRVTIALISVWFFVCLGGFTWLGIFGSAYMRVGPSATLTYMGMPIDTMPRYVAVVLFVMISTAINDFASDAIGPWIQNTVMDHKSQTIPYSKFTIIFITQTWSLYCGVMSVASIALVFAQFDLIMVRLVVDLFVNQYTMRRFLTNKAHDPFRYHNEFLNEDEMDTLADNGAGLETSEQLQRAKQRSVEVELKREAQDMDRRGARRELVLELGAAEAPGGGGDRAGSDGEPQLAGPHEAAYEPSQFARGKGRGKAKRDDVYT
jgi:hypothetical protein